MSEPEQAVETPYGRLDRGALQKLRNSFETMSLLRTIDELDALVVDACGEGGLRDLLLRLHGMTHTVINDGALSAATGQGTLPELADEVATQLYEAIGTLQVWLRRIEPLKELWPRD